jgi:aspartyl protease family protein
MKRALAAALAGLVLGAGAQSVALQGMLGSKALLIVDGSPPRSVAVGESHKGVTVISTLGDQALVEIAGKRHTLRVGEAPASVGAAGPAPRGNRIVIPAGSGGHFVTQGAINGQAVRFVVDTGATSISMGVSEAQRLGLDYRKGELGLAGTANGNVTMYRLKLASVRIGDVEVYDVDASVLPNSMPVILLGNSFLTRFQMKRENDLLVLERRY